MHIEDLRLKQLDTSFNFPAEVKSCIALEEVCRRILDGAVVVRDKLQLIGPADQESFSNFIADSSDDLKQSAIRLYELAQKSIFVINSDKDTEGKAQALSDILGDVFDSDSDKLFFSRFLNLVERLVGSEDLRMRLSQNALNLFRTENSSEFNYNDFLEFTTDVIVTRKRSKEQTLAHLLRVSPTSWNRNFISSPESTRFAMDLDVGSMRASFLSIVRHLLCKNDAMPVELSLPLSEYLFETLDSIRFDSFDPNEIIVANPPPEALREYAVKAFNYLSDEGMRARISQRFNAYLEEGNLSLNQIHVADDPHATVKNIIKLTAIYLKKIFPGFGGPTHMSDSWFEGFTQELAFVSNGENLEPFAYQLRRAYLSVSNTFVSGYPEAIITYSLESLAQLYTPGFAEDLFAELRSREIATIQAGSDRSEVNLADAQMDSPNILGVINPGSNFKIDQCFERFILQLEEIAHSKA